MEKIVFIVLTKSYKPGGRCIAGKVATLNRDYTLQTGHWVRPVPNDGRGYGAIPASMYRYADGSEVRILDIVEVIKVAEPYVSGQPENFIVDERTPWKKISTLRADTIVNLLDPMRNIWYESKIKTNVATGLPNNFDDECRSICLIQPTSLVITLSNGFNNYKVSAKKLHVFPRHIPRE